jgi:hypothetical protein
MGSLIPIFAYKIGKELKPRLGLPMALVFAFFPSYTLHSLYITPDIPITLFTLIIIFFTLKFLNTERNIFLYFAILFSAINTAEKYPGLLSLAIPVAGVFIKHFEGQPNLIKIEWWRITKTVIKIAVLFLVSLFLVAPNIFLHFPKVIEALTYESRSTHLGADNLGFVGNLIFYVNAFSSWSNWFALPFILLGFYGLMTKKIRYSIILLFGGFYWVLLSVLSLHWERWALPMYMTPLFLISIGIWYSAKTIKKNSTIKFFTILTSVIFFLIQLTHSLHTAVRMSFTDTRVIALDFCRNNEITKNNSLYEGYTPFQPQFPSEIFDKYNKAIEDKDFIILSSSMFGRFYAEPQRYEDKIHFYETIRDEFVLIEQFTPSPEADGVIEQIDDIIYYGKCLLNSCTKDKLKGPTIEIYRINN